MAALTITATAIIPSTGALFEYKLANAAITAGKTVYLDTDTDKFGLYDGNSATPAIYTLRGICVGPAVAADQPCTIQVAGLLAFGAILTKGLIYVGGATAAGDVNPSADLTTGWQVNTLGLAISTSVLNLSIKNTLVLI